MAGVFGLSDDAVGVLPGPLVQILYGQRLCPSVEPYVESYYPAGPDAPVRILSVVLESMLSLLSLQGKNSHHVSSSLVW